MRTGWRAGMAGSRGEDALLIELPGDLTNSITISTPGEANADGRSLRLVDPQFDVGPLPRPVGVLVIRVAEDPPGHRMALLGLLPKSLGRLQADLIAEVFVGEVSDRRDQLLDRRRQQQFLPVLVMENPDAGPGNAALEGESLFHIPT